MTKLVCLFQVVGFLGSLWEFLGLVWSMCPGVGSFICFPWLWFGLLLPELWVWLYVVGVLVDLYVRSGLEWFCLPGVWA